MGERLGLVFLDGSILVLAEGMDLNGARREAEEHDWGEPKPSTRIVRVEIRIIEII
jgi:hypothetical protein